MPSCCRMPSCKKKKRRRRRSKSCGRRRRPRRRSSCVKKCYRSGKITRNAFFNFLRCYRKQNCGKSIVQIAVEGARKWNKMSETQRCKYIQQANCAPKFRRRRKKSRRRKC